MDRKFSPDKLGSKFTTKNFLAGIGILSIILLAVGGVLAQNNGTASVVIGSNGVDLKTGTLNLNGNAIDGADEIKDQSSDTVANVNDSQNSLEVQNGFKLPVGADAYN